MPGTTSTTVRTAADPNHTLTAVSYRTGGAA